jgi:hypothetical protein
LKENTTASGTIPPQYSESNDNENFLNSILGFEFNISSFIEHGRFVLTKITPVDVLINIVI